MSICDSTTKPEDLANRLSKELSMASGSITLRESTDQLSMLARSNRMDGWNVSWGRQHASKVGFSAGSCFVFESNTTLVADKLKRLHREGLGERRAEGFGEIAIGHPLVSSSLSGWSAPSSSTGSGAVTTVYPGNGQAYSGSPDDDKFIKLLEIEAWRKEIHRRALGVGSNKTKRKEFFKWNKTKPSNSQLGTLRSVVMGSDVESIKHWLKHLQAIDKKKEKWPEGAIDKVLCLTKKENKVWGMVGLAEQATSGRYQRRNEYPPKGTAYVCC